MKGKVLGFSETDGTGAIAADDGTRHRFSRDDWRGERSPTAGMTVDFESEGGAAKDIYPMAGAAMAALSGINVDLGGLSSSADGAKIGALFTRSLAVPLALVVLVACFMPGMSTPMQTVSVLGIDAVAAQLNMVAQAQAAFGGEPTGSGGGETLLILRYLAPVAALWLIWAAWAGKSERLPMLATGAAAILAALVVVGLKSAIVGMAPAMARDALAATISLGMGVWLLFLAGGALIAAAMGKLRNPLSKG